MGKRTKAGKRHFGKSVQDTGFGTLRAMLEYKLADRLKTLAKADRWFASSQLCSSCGKKNLAVKDLSVREWACPSCGETHDRDVNAGKNLVNWYKSTVAQTGSYAHGDRVRPSQLAEKAVIVEVGKVGSLDESSPLLQERVC